MSLQVSPFLIISTHRSTVLTVDVRDAVGDRLHISDEFKKDSTTFELGQAQLLQFVLFPSFPPSPPLLVKLFPHQGGDKTRNLHDPPSSASQMLRLSNSGKSSKEFERTKRIVQGGNACRVYGSMKVKKVTGNLHLTTLGHGYLSWEHTDHARTSPSSSLPLD